MLESTRRRRTAFTLVELLVVIGIIAVLIGILIPVVAKMRVKAQAADTQNFIGQLAAAIEAYHGDFRAYPGPLSNNEVRNSVNSAAYPAMGSTVPPGTPWTQPFAAPATTGFDNTGGATIPAKITMTENMVLGLLGGLRANVPAAGQLQLVYDPSLVGTGATSLNPANPKKYSAYIDPTVLYWRTGTDGKTGRFVDDAGFADDTIIPEPVDKFADPLPVIYMRAKPGVASIPNTTASPAPANNNCVMSNDPNFTNGRPGAYDLSQIIAYTGVYNGTEGSPVEVTGTPPAAGRTIGVGKTPPPYFVGGNPQTVSFPYHGLRTVNPQATATTGTYYYYPLDGFAYIENPSIKNTARNKDSYILISAGIDRMYGTSDDIANFGSVLP